MDNNINQSNIVPEIPTFNEAPKTSKVSPEINNLTNVIQMRANTGLLDKNKNLYGVDLNSVTSIGTDKRLSLNKFDVGRDAYVELNSGKMIGRFEKYMPGINNEELLARQQDNKWSNGLLKFAGKVGVNVLGGTIGTVEGLINGIQMQSLSAVYNSDFNKYLDDLNTKLEYKLPNYYTEQEKNMNFGQKMGTANFWANDFMGGLSFLVGTVVSEGLWAVATGGTSLIAKGAAGGLTRVLTKSLTPAKSMRALNEVKSSGKAILRAGAKAPTAELMAAARKANKIVTGANTTRFMFTSAGFEAGVEARQYMKEATAEFEQQFLEQNGRRPTPEERAAFADSVANTGNGLFLGNVALVGSSNLTILGKMFLNKAPTKSISNSLFKKTFLGVGYKKTAEGGLKAITANGYQKAFGKAYGVLKAPIMEGVVEEGGQAVMSTAASKYVLSAYDKDNVGDGLSLIQSLEEGFKYAYGTKQGLTEVGLGALIGVLGGGMATNFRFNEVSGEREHIEDSVKYVNKFTRDNLIENLKFGAKMRQTTIDSEKARAEGSMTNEMRADLSSMANLAERAYYYQSMDETILDFNTAIDVMDDTQLKDEYGLNKDEIAEWKSSKKTEFAEVMDTHIKNLQFAEAIVGNTPIAGIYNIDGLDAKGVGDLKGAIAYTLTMGTKSDEFAEALANQIKANVATELGVEGIEDAVSVNEVLRKVDAEKLVAYKNKAAQIKKVERDIAKITKAVVKADTAAQVNQDKEGNKTQAKRAAELRLKLSEAEEIYARLSSEKTIAHEALNIGQLTDEIVTEEMLDNQATNVAKLADTISKISTFDPQRGELIKQLHTEYASAVASAKASSQLVAELLDPKTQVSTLSGWIGKIINKKKSVNGDTAQLFLDMVIAYQSDLAGLNAITGIREGKKEEETKPSATTNPVEIAPEEITNEQEFTQTEAPLQDTKSVVDRLKKKVKEIIQRDPYTSLEYQGEGFDFEAVAPKQEDLDRYNRLLGKITGGYISTILTRPFNSKNPRGLSAEEHQELQDLNKKLNNWKILSGITDGNNDSVADMLQLINQLETEYKLSPTKIEIDAIEIPTSEEAIAGYGRRPSNTIISPDTVVAKKEKANKNYQISHLAASSLLQLFPGSKLFVVQGKKQTDVTTMKPKVLAEFEKEVGTKFVLTTAEGTDLNFELVESQRLEVSIEDFDKAMPTSNIRVVDFGNNDFMPMYVKLGDEFTPLQGDFIEKSINDNEVITLDAQKLYDLAEGTPLRTVVNLNEVFNDKLMKDFKKEGKISEEEFINKLKIYLSTEGSANKIVGFMRAITDASDINSEAFAKLYLVRKQAARKALESKSKRVEVGITIPFSRTLLAAPNMNVKEVNGKLIAVSNNITQEALNMIDDYGYVLNGKVVTKNSNENLQYSKKDAIFAVTLSNRTENKNKKIPVVVFKHKGRTVVFPVSLNESKTSSKSEELLDILRNTEDSETAKVVKLNDFLVANNIDPKVYAIENMASPGVQEVFTLFTSKNEETGEPNFKDVVDVETWIDQDHNKTELLNSVRIGIDITNNPFGSPKGIMDFEGMTTPTERDMEIEMVDTLSGLAEMVNTAFANANPFGEMAQDSEFYQIWDGRLIEKTPNSYILKLRNTNTLIKAFAEGVIIPKAVKGVVGEDIIAEIKSEIKKYQLLRNGLKPNTTFVEEELSEEINEIENKCD